MLLLHDSFKIEKCCIDQVISFKNTDTLFCLSNILFETEAHLIVPSYKEKRNAIQAIWVLRKSN